MWWLTTVDGPLPVGDIVYGVGIVVFLVAGYAEVTTATSNSSHSSDDTSAKSSAETTPSIKSASSGSPKSPKDNKDKNYRGGSLYHHDDQRIDYEYYGNGRGNIHIHIKNEKFWFNPSTWKFIDKNGFIARKAIQALLKDPKIAKAIAKGLEYIRG